MRPLSLNHAFATLRDGRRVRSQEYSKWAAEFKANTAPYLMEIKRFFRDYRPITQALHAELTFTMPNLYTLRNQVSNKSFDLDNLGKCVMDNLFLHDIDDAQIVSLLLKKINGDKPSIKITLYTVPR